MARIQGITVEIGGDTVGLQNALKDVNNRSKELTKELKDVERMLKFNPNSTELLAQKQQLLTQQVAETTDKLNQLRSAEQQVQAQFERGDIGEEQYRGFRRELLATEQALEGYQQSITNMNSEQDRVQRGTRELSTIFDATGSSVQDYANVIGNRLVTAIQNGTATSRDLEYAFQRIGRQAIGAEGDIDRLRTTLSTVDDGNSIENIRRDMQQLQAESQQTEEAVNGIGDSLKTAAGALVAGGGLAGAISQALDLSSLDTKIKISMEIPEESVGAVKEVVRTIEAYGVDGEAALEGVRRQWALNKDATDEANTAVVNYAAGVAASFAGIDFNELIQETNEIAAALGITNEEAISLTNALLKTGFPPEQLDTISEYGTQMSLAGFSAAEIQSIFEKGINTKTWNIDNLNDGVKEARLTMAGFGSEVDKALIPLVEKSGISTKQFQDWGIAVAKGGKEGSLAMGEVAEWLEGIDDKTLQNDLATKVFGTKWEDQGPNMVAVYKDVADAVNKTSTNVDGMKKTMDTLKTDPVIQLKQAMADLKLALQPILAVIAELVGKLAAWGSENPKLLASIVGIGTAIGILVGAIAFLAPAFISISGAIAGAGGAAAVLGGALAILTGPIGLTIAALAGLGIGAVLVAKELKKPSLEAQIFSDKVSESTQKAVGSFLSLSDQATASLNQLSWSGQIVTGEMASSLVNTFGEMGSQILAEMQADHAEQLQATQTFFAQSDTLSKSEEAKIVENVQKSQEEQQQKVTDGQNRVKEILNTAKSEKRAITEAERQEINGIQESMKVTAVKVMSESEAEQKAILESLKAESGKITAEQAADTVKNATEQKDKVIKEANNQYKGSVAEIIRMRDESKTITKEQADKLIAEAERQRDGAVDNAVETHQKVVSEAKKQAGEHVNQVDWETGEVKSKWGVMKTNVSTKMSELGGDIKKGWENSKKNTMTIVEGLKTTAKTKFTEMKEAIGNKMDEVKGEVSKGWNKAKTYLEGISISDIGRDIVQGLIKGIGGKFGDVKSKISELASLIPGWAKDILDINSPSRVMADEVGQWIPAGVALGINNNLGVVKQASAKMADAAVPDFSSKISITKAELRKLHSVIASATKVNTKEIDAIEKESDKKRAEIRKEAEKKAKEVREKANATKKGMTAAHHKQINEIYAKSSKDREKITADEKKKIKEISNTSTADQLKALTEYVNTRKGLESMTMVQEVAFWKQASSEFKKGTKEKTQAQINYNKALDTLNKEQFNKEKNYVDNKKYYNKMSLSEELAAYQKYMSGYKKGSDERIHYEKEIYRIKQELQKQIDQINTDYLSKVQTLNQSLIDEELKLNEAYQKALDDRAKSLYTFSGIFDEVADKDVSGDTLLNNLQSQVTAFEDWQKNISELASKGINDGLLAELQEMGPKAGAEIAALNTLTDEQLNQYVALWKDKNRLAKEQATKELEGMKIETGVKIEELRADTATKLLAYQDEWRKAMTGAKGKVKNEMKEMPSIGQYAVSGLIDGLLAKKQALIQTAQAMADAVKSTFQSALDIHSPSRVFKGFGININEGLIEGIQESTSNLKSAMNNVYGSLANSAGQMIQQQNSTPAINNVAQQPSQTIENNYHFSYQSPKAIDPYEASRLARNSLRELALQV